MFEDMRSLKLWQTLNCKNTDKILNKKIFAVILQKQKWSYTKEKL